MKIVALVVCLAAVAAPSALAKGRISVILGDSTPRAGHTFPVIVRTGYVVPANDSLRLIALALGRGWYDIVGTVTGDSSLAHASIPRDSFEIKLVRVGARTWRAVVRLPRPDRSLGARAAARLGPYGYIDKERTRARPAGAQIRIGGPRGVGPLI